MDDNKPNQRESADDSETVRAPAKEVVFGRYELLTELGKGGMGVVWLALDRELNSRVALKFLREEMTSEADALKELKGEVIINRDLAHPNIIKTFDFVTNGRTSAISMEYVNGTNLHKLKAQRSGRFFEVADIQQWVWQLCEAMHYAHQQKVVHRDIKPANLMVNERGELKVGDFGIGRTVADTINRVTRNSAGTPPYMSPQQMMGEKAAPCDDIYSIGATIYDLLTGDPPFFRGAIREQTLAKVPPSMTARRQELERTGQPIPPGWERAVAASLAKDAAVRPPSARALREMLEGKPMAPAGGGGRRAGVKWVIAAAVLFLAGAGGAAYWKLTRLPPATPGPLPQAVSAPGKPSPTAPTQASISAPEQPAAPATAPAVATQPGPGPARVAASRTPIEDLVEAGKITQTEGGVLNAALRGLQGDNEKTLATRLVIDHSLAPEDWRNFTTLVPPADEMVAKLRPLLATDFIREKEFGWLHAAETGGKGEAERALARQLVEEKSLTPEQWRKETELYPRPKDPFLEKVKPLIADGTVVQAEGQWLRDALAGEKGDGEKALAGRLVDEKNITPGQWRARTAFSYALKEGAAVDPAQLPPAIDLALSDTVSLRLLRIEPGSYLRGSPPEERGRRMNEVQERVAIGKPFYIGIYEVTQEEYSSIMMQSSPSWHSPSYWRGNAKWPIDQVDWPSVAGGNGFLARLNRILATKYGGTLVADLPTEDEWEYACRAGTHTSFNNDHNISNSDSDSGLDLLANYNRAAGGKPKPVGSYQPNAWGLYDMHGNVSEWCQKLYIRGGSWQSNAANCRAAWRTQVSADASGSNQVGFRLVLRYRAPSGGS
ncbi:MAG: bifunctional serine/threonine-protein kinase/formylglycine-generating enzyme family protein [Opitutaceae bacterium]